MSYNDINRGGGGEKECEEAVLQNSGELESKSKSKSKSNSQNGNGSITIQPLTIDENLLVDPKQLFIGSKIGEGAHGKVYEGRSVAKSQINHWNKEILKLMLLLVNSCVKQS